MYEIHSFIASGLALLSVIGVIIRTSFTLGRQKQELDVMKHDVDGLKNNGNSMPLIKKSIEDLTRTVNCVTEEQHRSHREIMSELKKMAEKQAETQEILAGLPGKFVAISKFDEVTERMYARIDTLRNSH